MRYQKTLKMTTWEVQRWFNSEPTVGQTVLLFGQDDVMNDYPETLIVTDQYPDGFPGNSDRTIKCYHGWRGITNDISTHAYGLRKILKVSSIDMGVDFGYKITVGPDLRPDWD